MERKYYLVEYSYGDVHPTDLTDEQFKLESIKQDLVYTQKEFLNSFNYGGRVDSTKHYLRIL